VVSAAYSGDSRYNPSTSAGLTQQVVKIATATALTRSPNPSVFGGSVTLTATVTPAGATGAVQFFDGSTLLGASNLSGGQAQLVTSSLTAGVHSLTASYSGTATHDPSTSSPVSQTVNKANSTTTLSANPPSPSHVGETVTFTAQVAPAAATGTVQFKDGSTIIGTAQLSGGTAVFATSSLAKGNHSIRAVYLGDANVNGSQSTSMTYRVRN
jgi:hypothetical protein